ncbi:MAG: hypothetical protein ACLR23_13920 [Clostridia bacterium]
MPKTKREGVGQMPGMAVGKKPKKSIKLFFMLVPCLLFVFIFSYLPLRGWIYAFTDYKAGLPWSKVNFVGLENFTKMFANEALRSKVGQVMINTVATAGLNILFSPLAAIFAIFLNEMRSRKYQRVVQSLTTLPHFISWVIMYSVAFFMLSNSGFVNTLLIKMGNPGDADQFSGDAEPCVDHDEGIRHMEGTGMECDHLLSGHSGD